MKEYSAKIINVEGLSIDREKKAVKLSFSFNTTQLITPKTCYGINCSIR